MQGLRSNRGQIYIEAILGIPLVLGMSFLCLAAMGWLAAQNYLEYRLHEWLICRVSYSNSSAKCFTNQIDWSQMSMSSLFTQTPDPFCKNQWLQWQLGGVNFQEDRTTVQAEANLIISLHKFNGDSTCKIFRKRFKMTIPKNLSS